MHNLPSPEPVEAYFGPSWTIWSQFGFSQSESTSFGSQKALESFCKKTILNCCCPIFNTKMGPFQGFWGLHKDTPTDEKGLVNPLPNASWTILEVPITSEEITFDPFLIPLPPPHLPYPSTCTVSHYPVPIAC